MLAAKIADERVKSGNQSGGGASYIVNGRTNKEAYGVCSEKR